MNLAFESTEEAIATAVEWKKVMAAVAKKHPDDYRFATEENNALWRNYERHFLGARSAFEEGA